MPAPATHREVTGRFNPMTYVAFWKVMIQRPDRRSRQPVDDAYHDLLTGGIAVI